MKVLDLFAGSRSFSKIADDLGHETFSVDINPFDGIDYITDIMDFNSRKVPFKPDLIWASPPCTTFSVASIGHHWGGGKRGYIPKTANAYRGMAFVKKTLEIIELYNPRYWYMENPRGVLRKLDLVKGLPFRNTVWYCTYGDDRAKPTDIWTNDNTWNPRPVCKNGNKDCHHAPAPRGSRTGTQGRKNNHERSKVPQDLCLEILANKEL